MTVVYACDERYASLMAISAVSVLQNNTNVRIVLLGYGLTVRALDLVRNRVERYSGAFSHFDVGKELQILEKEGYTGYTSYATYARIFIPQFLTENGRVLYLDCDTLVNGPLDNLFETDMAGKPFALSGDCIPRSYKKFIGHPECLPYYNAGVMLIDLDVWRKRRCTERVLEELRHPRGPNPLGDQDVIVRCFPEETAPLLPKWNALSQYSLVSYRGLKRIVGEGGLLPFSAEDYEEARKRPAISHFSGHTLGRPWFTSSRHPMRAAYRKTAQNAGLAAEAEQERPMPMAYAIQYGLYRLLPQSWFDIVCCWLYRIHVFWEYGVRRR